MLEHVIPRIPQCIAEHEIIHHSSELNCAALIFLYLRTDAVHSYLIMQKIGAQLRVFHGEDIR